MILVAGRTLDVVAALTEALSDEGNVVRVATLTDADPGDVLLDTMWSERSSHSPAHPVLVWVTARPNDDACLGKIRRSGAPYVIVRTGKVVRPGDLAPQPILGRDVLLPPDFPVPDAGLCTPSTIASYVATVVRDDQAVGRTVAASLRGAEAWSSVVAAFGARAHVAGKVRTRWARWFGPPVLQLARVNEPGVTERHRAQSAREISTTS
jgi:hypothetical protein